MIAPDRPRRFVARTAAEALGLAQQALGLQARVLSSRPWSNGVELVAVAPQGAALDQAIAPGHQAAPSAAAGDAPGDARGEARHVDAQAAPAFEQWLWQDRLRRSPRASGLMAQLQQGGFSNRLVQALMDDFEPLDARHAPRQNLAHDLDWALQQWSPLLHCEAPSSTGWRGVVALVGAAGAGKSASAAALAQSHVEQALQRAAPVSLGLVVLAPGAAAAGPQHGAAPSAFTRWAADQGLGNGPARGLVLHVVRNAHELAQALRQCAACDLTVIDTEGASAALAPLLAGGLTASLTAPAWRANTGPSGPVRAWWVAHALMQAPSLEETLCTFAAQAGALPVQVVLSHLDECRHLGSALDVLMRRRVTLAALAQARDGAPLVAWAGWPQSTHMLRTADADSLLRQALQPVANGVSRATPQPPTRAAVQRPTESIETQRPHELQSV